MVKFTEPVPCSICRRELESPFDVAFIAHGLGIPVEWVCTGCADWNLRMNKDCQRRVFPTNAVVEGLLAAQSEART